MHRAVSFAWIFCLSLLVLESEKTHHPSLTVFGPFSRHPAAADRTRQRTVILKSHTHGSTRHRHLCSGSIHDHCCEYVGCLKTLVTLSVVLAWPCARRLSAFAVAFNASRVVYPIFFRVPQDAASALLNMRTLGFPKVGQKNPPALLTPRFSDLCFLPRCRHA